MSVFVDRPPQGRPSAGSNRPTWPETKSGHEYGVHSAVAGERPRRSWSRALIRAALSRTTRRPGSPPPTAAVPITTRAGHGPAATALVRCNALPCRESLNHLRIAWSDATRSDTLGRSAARPALLAAARLHRAVNSRRPNPHSAHGALAPYISRVPSLEAFGRRPRCQPRRRNGPSSETLHSCRRPWASKCWFGIHQLSAATAFHRRRCRGRPAAHFRHDPEFAARGLDDGQWA